MKYLTVALLSMLLVACDGAKARLIKKLYDNRVSTANAGTILSAGTLISWGCDDYTRLNEIADGAGGSTTEEIDRSPDCGWDPPAAGTVVEESCDDYDLIEQIADGEYGTTERRTERSEECGWEDPVAVFDIRRATGDRFRPVLVDVTFEQFGQPYDGEFKPEVVIEETDQTIGRVEVNKDKTGVKVYGDGREGDASVSLNGDQIPYFIGNEPRCGIQSDFTDCMGYRYSGPSSGYIYYGEEDQRMVTWEIVVVYYEGSGDSVSYLPGDANWSSAQRRIDKYNESMERSRVYVEFKLVAVLGGNFGGADIGPAQYNKLRSLGIGADVAIGVGSTCEGACGCAYVNKTFRLGRGIPVDGTSACGWNTDLHEIGHAVGLAHGPQNSGNEAEGYIWRDFGHGWAPFCSYYADIMSYNATRYTFHNSKFTCGEVYGSWGNSQIQNELDDPAGSRDYADSAYHLNRVRYDVSLINNENDWEPPADYPLQFIEVKAQEKGRILVID